MAHIALRFCRKYMTFPTSRILSPATASGTTYSQRRFFAYQRRDPHKRNFPKEEKPDYDLEGDGFFNDGELIIPPPERTLTDVEEVQDPEIWKCVERLLPRKTVPELPHHESYPTPSGWVPPREDSLELPYQVPRTKYHHFPLYLEILDGGNRKMTCIDKVHGDVWQLEGELRPYLEELLNQPVFTQVDEVCTKLRVRGNFMEEVSTFLLEKGF